MVGLFTILSVAFNAAHAYGALLEMTIFGLPVTLVPHVTMPIALFFGFEMLMRQIHNAIARAGVIKSLANLRAEWDQKQADMAQELAMWQDELNTLSQRMTALENEISEKTARVAELQQEISQREQTLKTMKRNITSAKIRKFIPGDLNALDRANETRAATMAQRRKELPVRLQSGWTVGDLADHFGVDLKTIQRDATALGIKMVGRGRSARMDNPGETSPLVISDDGADNFDQREIIAGV
jgi:hypothetical protein